MAGGVPVLFSGEALLFDSERAEDAGRLPETATFSRLEVRFPAGEPPGLPADAALLLFVGDLTAPRARVRLADLRRQGGLRPLNVGRRSGERVRLVLSHPSAAWPDGVALEVALAW